MTERSLQVTYRKGRAVERPVRRQGRSRFVLGMSVAAAVTTVVMSVQARRMAAATGSVAYASVLCECDLTRVRP
jgi:hypothetical protein